MIGSPIWSRAPALVCAALLLPGWNLTWAHKESDAYMNLSRAPAAQSESTVIAARFDVSLRDLDGLIDLDADGDHRLTWREVRAKHGALEDLVRQSVQFSTTAGPCVIGSMSHAIDRHSDGGYAVVTFSLRCAEPASSLQMTYRFLDGVDTSHRLILTTPTAVRALSAAPTAVPIGWTETPVTARAGAGAEPANSGTVWLGDFISMGIKHIALGWDHLAFLLLLIIPLAVQDAPPSTPGCGRDSRARLTAALIVITAFTVAHSITLALAVTGVVRLSDRLIESVIAASIVVAALMNLLPAKPRAIAALAFGFGLIHGFGFASALRDFGLQGRALWTSLFGFNLGVEIGQLAVFALIWPLAGRLRGALALRQFGVPALSLLLAVIGSMLLVGRALGLGFF